MAYVINFQKIKRNYMTVTFEDESTDGTLYERTICVGMPKKRIFDKLMDISDMTANEEPQTQEEKNKANRLKINALYDVAAEILSNNLSREKFTAEWVGDMMTTDELKGFMQQYAKFARGEAQNPN